MKVNIVGDISYVKVSEELYPVTSKFKDFEEFRSHEHNGIDIAMNPGTDIYSPVEGVISKIVDYGDENLGRGIFIQLEDGKTVILGHLSNTNVREGDYVSIGEKIAESGNTGNVVGDGHLHIGLKDENGNFIDPEKIENSIQEVSKAMIEKGNMTPIETAKEFINTFKDFKQYTIDIKTEGFWKATFDKSFVDIVIDGFASLIEFFVSHNDLFFVIPAVIFMFATMFVGGNKFTKWIIPLWFAYFVTTIIRHTMF